jgi:phosphoglycolate phosphatase
MYGSTSLPEVEVKNLIGLPARYLFADLDLSQIELERIVVEFRERLKFEILLKNETYPEVEVILTELKDRGVRLSVATTKPTGLAMWTIKHSRLNGLIDHIQGTDNFAPKPSPEVIIRCLQPGKGEEVFMFGDRIEDMQAAVAANVTGIGITQTVHDSEALEKAGAVLTLSEFRLIKQIPELFPI